VPAVRAFVCGTGPMQGEVEARIRELDLGDAVTLLGRRHDIGALFTACDVVLLTSDNEGTPNVALEAHHYGRPVVCCDVGGSAEAVRDGATGHVHAKDDLRGLAASCAALLADPERARRLGAAGRRHVHERYSLDGLVDGSQHLYTDA
jgi:glycosyltransferase involved in cell wall biosynthesis